jgi:hypothetical protein
VSAEVFDLAVVRGAIGAAVEAAELDRREAAVRADLSGAVTHLTFLREAGAHTLRGFDSWGAYVADRFGDLLAELRLAVGPPGWPARAARWPRRAASGSGRRRWAAGAARGG